MLVDLKHKKPIYACCIHIELIVQVIVTQLASINLQSGDKIQENHVKCDVPKRHSTFSKIAKASHGESKQDSATKPNKSASKWAWIWKTVTVLEIWPESCITINMLNPVWIWVWILELFYSLDLLATPLSARLHTI